MNESRSAKALSEVAHDAISQLIRNRELRSGELIVEQKLAERLGISRTPLREALQRLEGEGLMIKSSGRSYVVRTVDLTEYLQSLKAREILECEAAALAASRIPAEKIAATKQEIIELQNQTSYHSNDHWQSDDNIHDLIADHCGNAVIAQLTKNLRVTTRLFEIAGLAERVDPDSVEHLAILRALKSGDPQKARKAMSTHIKSLIKYSLVDLS